MVKCFSDSKLFVRGLGPPVLALCLIIAVKSVSDQIWNIGNERFLELFCFWTAVLVRNLILIASYKSKTVGEMACESNVFRGSDSKLIPTTPVERVSTSTSLRFYVINLTVFRVFYYCVSPLMLISFRNPFHLLKSLYYLLFLTFQSIICDVVPWSI